MTSTATIDRCGLFRAITTIVVAALMIASCTTTRPIDPGALTSLVDEVQPGDRVKITTRDGRELAFEVVRVEPDALLGAEQRVARDEIASLEVTQTSPGKTVGLVGGGFLFVLMAIGVALAVIAPPLLGGG